MADERTYNIPLRRDWLHVARYKRTKKAVRATKEFLVQHMKVSEKDIKLGKFLNENLWEHGIKNPPHHIKVVVTKDKDGKVFAELVGAPVEKKEDAKKAKPIKAEEKTEEKKSEVKEAKIVSEEKPKKEKKE